MSITFNGDVLMIIKSELVVIYYVLNYYFVSYFYLSHFLLADFACFCCWRMFLKIIFVEKLFQKYHLSVKQFGSISDLGPNSL